MLTQRVLNSSITRASVVEVDIGGVNHKVECSTEIGADLHKDFNKSLSTVYLDKFVSYGLMIHTLQ